MPFVIGSSTTLAREGNLFLCPTFGPMTTATAIDRLVHHSVVLELNVPNYRPEETKKRRK
jgi:DNA replication protein DnaC